MQVTRDDLERNAIRALFAEKYDDAVFQLQWIAALGYPPPTASVNAAMEKEGSKVRLWEGTPTKVSVNGPHGGGCDITYPMAIRKVNAPLSDRQFDYVVKVRWDRDGGWFGTMRHHIARGVVGLVVNKIAPHTTVRIAKRIGIISKSRVA